ncbi:MAG: SAF domain-containing protein [Armatimonadota bacterium]|nr:SAF domain-containing protein [Armatimonadota bacterium]
MRRIQILVGVLLAVAAFVGVLLLGRLSQPPMYEIAVVVKDVPAFAPLQADMVAIDTWSVSPAVAARYVSAADWEKIQAEGAVAVENLRAGQPLLRDQVATGAAAEKASRLSVALKDPDRVILAVPVGEGEIPGIAPGDVVALFYAAGSLNAQALITQVVTGGITGTVPTVAITPTEVTTETVELKLPLSKWIANGVVYRVLRERRENPNYGAPGMENEPRYIEGAVQALEVVVRREDVEWIAFALAHGKVRVGLLPAVTRADVEQGTFPPSKGVTWTDFERRFFEEREK